MKRLVERASNEDPDGAARTTAGPVGGATASRKATPRRPGSGGIFAVRAGVWRVDIELPRDKVTGRRRRVSRNIDGSRHDAEMALARLKMPITSVACRRAEPQHVRSGRHSICTSVPSSPVQ